MSKAPERVWLYVDVDDQGEAYLELIRPDAECSTDVEYRRADAPPTLAEAMAVPEVAALVEALEVLQSHLRVGVIGAYTTPLSVDDGYERVNAALANLKGLTP
jgi:hypothetical protein